MTENDFIESEMVDFASHFIGVIHYPGIICGLL